MAAPLKKRDFGNDNKKSLSKKEESEGSSDEDSVTSNKELTGQEEIQVDFEGRNPIDSDFHGIKQLLQQLFLKAHINLSELTDLLIKQNYIGSVVKQSDVDGDSDEDDMETNDVFGVTSVVSLTDKQNLECVQQLRALLQEMCRTHGTDQANTVITSLLQNDTRPIGLMINERFVNIPAQISIPLLENLSKEMTRACNKKMPFDFSHLVLICKLYRMENKKKKKARGKAKEPEVLWSNPEEEVIDQFADARFEFSVKAESDTGLAGMWTEDDGEMVPYRRVLVFRASKMPEVLEAVRNFV